jgi:hypothetical protein
MTLFQVLFKIEEKDFNKTKVQVSEPVWLFMSLQMGTPASSGLSVSTACPAAPVLPKAPVVIDQSDMYTNVFSRFADRHTKDGDVVGVFSLVSSI